MDLLIVFFRDVLSGIWYFLYLALCIFIIFYILGIIGDRKREAIAVKLKNKKKFDIESGREAEIAAKQTKQIINVLEENQDTSNNAASKPQGADATANKEEIPAVMVLNSSTDGNEQKIKKEEPLVINSSSIKDNN